MLSANCLYWIFPTEEYNLNPPTAIAEVNPSREDDIISIPQHDVDRSVPAFCPLLLVSYRLLAYFTWNCTFSHIRKRLLETSAGGLHSSALSIFPILSECLKTFDSRLFTPLPSFIQAFMQISFGFPDDLQKELFPILFTNNNRTPSPIIHLEHFPVVSNSTQLSLEFSRIFDYLPDATKLIFTQSSLLFACPEFANIQKSHFLEFFSNNITTSEESKTKTSETNRPIVLRFSLLLLESTIVGDVSTSPPLLIEAYHPDQLCVTVYNPTGGVRSVPLSDVLSYQVVGIYFKRSSKPQLVCSELLQRFSALALPKPPKIATSNFSMISLFDGSGSFTDVISHLAARYLSCGK